MVTAALGALHLLLAIVYGAVLVLLAVTSFMAYGGRPNRLLADRLVLAGVILATGAALVGLTLLALSAPPADPLHLLYGAVAVAVLPGVRYAGRNALPRRLAVLLGVAALALLGVLFRLWTTG